MQLWKPGVSDIVDCDTF